MARKRSKSSPAQKELVLTDSVRRPSASAAVPATVVDASLLPPILIDNGTPAAAAKVRTFYLSVEELFERWVTRRESPHTQRAYRKDILSLLDFLSIDWPQEAMRLFTVSVGDVQ